MLRSLMIGGLLLIIGTTACGAKDFVMQGFGGLTCGEFAKHYAIAPDIEDSYFAWAQGFMSATNLATVTASHVYRNLGASTTKAQMSFLRNYCDQHPLADYESAVMELLRSLPMNNMPADTSAH
jgi:hypothetical protein